MNSWKWLTLSLTCVCLFVLSACGSFQAGGEATPVSPGSTFTHSPTSEIQPGGTPTPEVTPTTLPEMTPALTPTQTPAAGSPETGQPVQIRQIRMLDTQNGWAIGRVAGDSLDHILFTSDGGKTWQNRTPSDAPQEARTSETSPAAFFESAQHAWVSYPILPGQPDQGKPPVWFTRDGGQTWTASQPLSLSDLPMEFFNPSDLGFLDTQFGWLMAHLGVGMSHDYIAIFTTTDGGQTWQRVTDPDKDPEIQGCVKSGLIFTSQTNGWLAGNCPGLMPPLFLYHTSDGGVTWSRAALPTTEGQPADMASQLGDHCGVSQMAGISADVLRLTLRCFNFDQNVTHAWLYSSPDKGQTWQTHSLPVPYGTFDFINSMEGWLLGSGQDQPSANQEIFHSLDGGRTWNSLSQTEQQGKTDFVDSQNGWIAASNAGDQALLHSTDGGKTWQNMEPIADP